MSTRLVFAVKMLVENHNDGYIIRLHLVDFVCPNNFRNHYIVFIIIV